MNYFKFLGMSDASRKYLVEEALFTASTNGLLMYAIKFGKSPMDIGETSLAGIDDMAKNLCNGSRTVASLSKITPIIILRVSALGKIMSLSHPSISAFVALQKVTHSGRLKRLVSSKSERKAFENRLTKISFVELQ